jgi:hypothetical protein
MGTTLPLGVTTKLMDCTYSHEAANPIPGPDALSVSSRSNSAPAAFPRLALWFRAFLGLGTLADEDLQ